MTPTHPTGITRLSGLFRCLSLLALILCVLIALTFLFATIKSSNEGRYTPYFLGGTLLPLLALPIAFHFFRFFSRLRAGHRFDPATVSHLHNAGRWWLAFATYDFALSLYGRFALQMTQLQIPLTPFLNASLILLTAWLLREAQLLQHDNELTV